MLKLGSGMDIKLQTIFCLHVLIDIYIYMSFGKNYIAHLLTLKRRLIQFGGCGYDKNW